MSTQERHAVTGVFGYSGRRIALRLRAEGRAVVGLTNSPDRDGVFGGGLPVHPLDFDRPDDLARALEGAEVLYNTYWVRFNHRRFTHARAVRNTELLFAAARRAGVRRIVHVSITNPDEASPLEYFAGKGRLERVLRETGIPHSILRPAVLFGGGDILINNIAWALRRLPVFAVFGDGRYRLQPIHVDDLAALAVAEGKAAGERVVQAIGPETFTFRELVEHIGEIIGRRRPMIHVSPALGYAACRLIGWCVRDTFLTREEIAGLMAGLLAVDAPPAGATRLSDWVASVRDTLGLRYASELARRR